MSSQIPPQKSVEPEADQIGPPTQGSTTKDDSAPTVDYSPVEIEDRTAVSQAPLLDAGSAFAGLQPRELGMALVGHKIDDVVLEEFIGGGGMGAVLRGHDVVLQRTVAVKVLSTSQAGDEETEKRFRMEARSAARLDHPRIARVYYVGEDRGLRFIIFEYIEGTNVRDLVIAGGPLSLADTVSYALQISDALTHAWERGVVHRDIKPSNILITADGQAKLVDMGLARVYQVGPSEQADHELTATGMTLGTFDYIAPEQARNPRDADTRSDIYSLGCTIYYMLTGRPPFPGGTPLQKLLSHQADRPPELATLRPDTPPALAAIVSRMLAKAPEARYQSPLDLTAALSRLAEQLGVGQPTLSSLPRAAGAPTWSPAWSRHLPWIVPTGLVAAGVIALALFWQPGEAPTKFDSNGLSPSAETDIEDELERRGPIAPSAAPE
jgi:serine/threonine protein kinase